MTKRQFVVLVFRLFALYLVYNAIANLGYIYAASQQMGLFERFGAGAIIIPLFALMIALSIITLLWSRSEWLMEKIFAIPALSEPTIEAVDDVESDAPQVTAADSKADESGSSTSGETLLIQDYYETPISIESIELVAISIVGLLEAFGALPRLLQVLDLLLSSSSSVVSWIRIGGPEIIQVGFGAFLFLRPWQVQQWIAKLKPQSNYDDDAGAPTPQA